MNKKFRYTINEVQYIFGNIILTHFREFYNFIKYNPFQMYITGGILREIIADDYLHDHHDLTHIPYNRFFEDSEIDVIVENMTLNEYLESIKIAERRYNLVNLGMSNISGKCISTKLGIRNEEDKRFMNILYFGRENAKTTVSRFDYRFNTLLFNPKLIKFDTEVLSEEDFYNIVYDIIEKKINVLDNPIWDLSKTMLKLSRFISRGFTIDKDNYQVLSNLIYSKIEEQEKEVL